MDPAVATWRLGRRPALDGLRGVAVALVVLSHAEVPHLGHAGHIGVTVFFTLSGFLIATLLFEEKEARGRLALRRFYRRRLLRLAPALLAVALVTASFAAAARAPWVTPREVVGAVFYCSNLLSAVYGPVGGAHMLHHTWSLVIEEQFYLVWPTVVILAGRRRGALFTVLVLASIGSLALRVALWDEGAGVNRVLFGTGTRVDGILVGCALAVALRGRLPFPRRLAGPAVVAGLAAVVVLAVVRWDGAMTWGLSLASLATALVIAGVLSGGTAALTSTAVTWLGRRSYGLYLWHHPVAIFLGAFALAWPVRAAILVPSSLLLTVLSWRCIEKPFLDLRERDADRGPSPLERGVVDVGKAPPPSAPVAP